MAIPTISDYPMPQPTAFPANRTGWRPDPARAVLLIHDMQSYFLRFYDAEGALLPCLIDNLARVRGWARANGVPVVYTAQPYRQSPEERGLLTDMWGPGLTTAVPEQQQVVAVLAPDEDDTVLVKWRYSAFKRSDLLERLKGWGRDQLVIGGVYAHIGCMMTAADAFMSDIQPFLVGDAVADFSEAEHHMALRYVATRCGSVIDTASLCGLSVGALSQDWLTVRVGQLVEEGTALDPDENLIYYGLDSVQVMQFAAELKQHGISIGFDELVRVPTLNGWWTLIEQRRLAA